VGELLDLLWQQGPWDGVLLALHGAAVSEDHPDADGEIAHRVRALVGAAVPIGLAIDVHADISQKMIDNVTATVVYRTNPHLDARIRARMRRHHPAHDSWRGSVLCRRSKCRRW
jgi:microcystin degradation protein MlrC